MIYASKMPFPTFWDHSQWKCHAQYYITDKRQRMVLKRLVKQRKHYLPLARKSFKNWENIKWNWEAGNIHWNQEVSGQKGRAGISVSMALWTKIDKGQVDNKLKIRRTKWRPCGPNEDLLVNLGSGVQVTLWSKWRTRVCLLQDTVDNEESALARLAFFLLICQEISVRCLH